MATIDVGKLSFTHKGNYDASVAYVEKDVVYYNGSAYIAKTSTTGNLPTSTAHWNLFVLKGTDTSVLTTQGDVLYHDGSSLARLGAGTSGQFLKTQGTGANPVWADSGGKTLALTHSTNNTRTTLSNVNTESNLMTGTHTQVKANSKLLVHYKFPFWADSSGSCRTFFKFDGTATYEAWGWLYAAFGSNTNTWTGSFLVDASSSTGSKNWSIGWHSNSSTTAKPAGIWNPNNTDNDRMSQTFSEIIILELDF